MSTEKPEALRLADLIRSRHGNDLNDEAAAELHRLADIERRFYELQRHGVLRAVYEKVEAQRDALLEALQDLMQQYKDQPECFMDWSKARAAIKAVEGEKA